MLGCANYRGKDSDLQAFSKLAIALVSLYYRRVAMPIDNALRSYTQQKTQLLHEQLGLTINLGENYIKNSLVDLNLILNKTFSITDDATNNGSWRNRTPTTSKSYHGFQDRLPSI